jgi:hypothetical protein
MTEPREFAYYVPNYINEGDLCQVTVERRPGEGIAYPTGWSVMHRNTGSTIYQKRWFAGQPRKEIFYIHPVGSYVDSWFDQGEELESEEETPEETPEEFKGAAAFAILSKHAGEALRASGADRVSVYYESPDGTWINADFVKDEGEKVADPSFEQLGELKIGKTKLIVERSDGVKTEYPLKTSFDGAWVVYDSPRGGHIPINAGDRFKIVASGL